MKRQPTYYNLDSKDIILLLETRTDKVGNIYYYVTWQKEDKKDYARFVHLSSALDFINSNFK